MLVSLNFPPFWPTSLAPLTSSALLNSSHAPFGCRHPNMADADIGQIEVEVEVVVAELEFPKRG